MYEVLLSSMSLLGFGMGAMLANFYMYYLFILCKSYT